MSTRRSSAITSSRHTATSTSSDRSDEHGVELARRAAKRLSNAGRRALARGDMPAAVNLLERAVTLVPRSHPERSELLLKLGIALAETGELGRADALLSERISEARRGLPYLSYSDGNGRQKVFDLEGESRVRIGRNPANDVPLAWDVEVSRSHASLIDVDGSWVLLDDGRSHNGSFVNGQRVADRHRPQGWGHPALRRDADPLPVSARPSGIRARLGPPPQDRRPRSTCRARCSSPKCSNGCWSPSALLVDDSAPTSGAAADEEIANQLALSVEAVRENLWALSHVYDAEELPEDERVARIVERARRSGVIDLQPAARP